MMINKQSHIMNKIINKQSHITGSNNTKINYYKIQKLKQNKQCNIIGSNKTMNKQSHIMNRIINKQSHITGS